MSRLSLRASQGLLVFSLLVGCFPVAMAASPPTLFSVTSGKAEVMAQGAQKSWPIKVSEDNAFDAVFKGGLWLPNPSGGRIYAKYQRHILHANGTWSWIGTVSTVHGAQSVVLTFGKDGVFGLIPQASGYPLRIVTSAGKTRVVETSAAGMARSSEMLRLRSRPDYVLPPRVGKGNRSAQTSVPAAADAPVQAAAGSGPVTIDVMVAYTPGFVTEMGSQSAALTRIQNLIDLTNQAYLSSGVNQQIRLVKTVEVDYADNTSNQSALDQLTGIDENGNPVTIPASLQGIASLRVQNGADLVALVRSFDNATQGNCGVGWLIGGNQAPIVSSESNAYGYSVVSDGTSNDLYCLDTTFAHELGHNMGDAHDRANATEPGAYSYSYGYKNDSPAFSTIMAYGSADQTPLSMFSNPNISSCKNTPCGVADSSSSSADNAHSMNNTAALIAAFEPTMVGTPPSLQTYVHNDVNGDGKSDLLWRSIDNRSFAYWIMNGTQLASSLALPVSTTYKLLATGDFNGDGFMDTIWTDGTGMWMWVGNGSKFTSTYMRPYPSGWKVVGTTDLNGDGKTDLIWVDGSRIAEWLMNGTTFSATYLQYMSNGWSYLTAGDFDGDGNGDLLLTNGSAMQMWTQFTNGAFTQVATHTYPPGWTLLGTGDVDGDGKADLLWRDNARARFAYWIMNGPQLTSSWAVAVSSQWTLGTTGDFYGTGMLNLVWYNKSAVVMWSRSGVAYSGTVIHSYPSNWTLLP